MIEVTSLNLRFPKRFEIEGLDPYTLKVKVVFKGGYRIYNSLDDAVKVFKNFNRFCGPMACKIDGKWCIRFESSKAYDYYSK